MSEYCENCSTCKHCNSQFECQNGNSEHWNSQVLYSNWCEWHEARTNRQKHHSVRYYKENLRLLEESLSIATDTAMKKELRRQIQETKVALRLAKEGKQFSLRERFPLAFPDGDMCHCN